MLLLFADDPKVPEGLAEDEVPAEVEAPEGPEEVEAPEGPAEVEGPDEHMGYMHRVGLIAVPSFCNHCPINIGGQNHKIMRYAVQGGLTTRNGYVNSNPLLRS